MIADRQTHRHTDKHAHHNTPGSLSGCGVMAKIAVKEWSCTYRWNKYYIVV